MSTPGERSEPQASEASPSRAKRGTLRRAKRGSDLVLAADGTQVRLRAAGCELLVPQSGQQLSGGQAVTVALRPEKLALQSSPGTNGSGLPGIVQELVFIGTDTRYVVRLETGEMVTVRVQNAGQGSSNSWRSGDPVQVHWEQQCARILTA